MLSHVPGIAMLHSAIKGLNSLCTSSPPNTHCAVHNNSDTSEGKKGGMNSLNAARSFEIRITSDNSKAKWLKTISCTPKYSLPVVSSVLLVSSDMTADSESL